MYPDAAPSLSSSRFARILVADDHEWIREVVVAIVRQTLPAAEITQVEDGAKALRSYQRTGCDFLVTNHLMPEMDGMTLIRHVREQSPGLPILMVSVKPEAEVDAMSAGANWFLAKVDLMEHLPGLLLRHAVAPSRN